MNKSIQKLLAILMLFSGVIFAGSIKMRKSVSHFREIETFSDEGTSAAISKNEHNEYCLEVHIYRGGYGFPDNRAGKWFEKHINNCIRVRCEDPRLGFPFTFYIKPEFLDKTSIKNVKASMLRLMREQGLSYVDQFISYTSIKSRHFSYVLYTKHKNYCSKKLVEIYGSEVLDSFKRVNS